MNNNTVYVVRGHDDEGSWIVSLHWSRYSAEAMVKLSIAVDEEVGHQGITYSIFDKRILD